MKPCWISVKQEPIYLRTKDQDFEEISQELAQVTQKFSEQVLDATNAWKLVVNEEDKLIGLPETAKEAARQTAIEKLGEEEGKDVGCSLFKPLRCCRFYSTLRMMAFERKYGRQAIRFA